MATKRLSDTRLEFSEEPESPTTLLIAFLMFGAVFLFSLQDGHPFYGAVVLFIGLVIWHIYRRGIQSELIFDRDLRQATILEHRWGRTFTREQIAFDKIERVIVDALLDSETRNLVARPAFLVDEKLVPVAFAAGQLEPSIGIVADIRAFLGHPAGDIIEESLDELSKRPGRRPAAEKLARKTKGLSRKEAKRIIEEKARKT